MRVAVWFAATRLIIFAIGVIGAANFVDLRTEKVLNSTAALNPEVVWQKWDAVWYEEISRLGYGNALDTAHGQALAGYFPLYPIVVRGAMMVWPGSPPEEAAKPDSRFFWAGSLLSNLFTLGALWLLAWGFIEQNAQNETLRNVLAVTLTSAGSFYLSIPYTEGLFLLLVVGALVLTKRRQYELAGLVAGLSATTRVHGLALVAVPAIACWIDRSPGHRRWLRAAATVALFALPFLVYMAHLKSAFGSAFAFVNSQALWDNPSPYPFAALTSFLRFPTRLTVWLHGGFWLLYLGLLVRYWRRMAPGEALFCLGVFLISTQQPQFQGTYRYMVPLVPLSIAIANDRREIRDPLIAFNIAFGVLMIVAFVTWNRLVV